jgi:putative nucleotidyltransferase with HDIG domain
MTNEINLKIAIDKLDSLPALPAIAQKLLSLSLDTDEGEAKMLKLIAQDPLISAKIIGLSNTSMFGSPVKVTSVSDAAMRLGLTRVKSVAIGIATMSTLTKFPEGQLKANDLWIHSMAIAVAMRTIAKAMPGRKRPLDDQIFLAGLLHDIGYMALSYLDTRASDELHSRFSTQPDRPMLEIEQELLGINHGEIGARVGQHWNLPDEIIAVMRYHHTPDVKEAAEGQPLVRLVSFAERMLSAYGLAEHTEQEITDQEWLELGIDPAKAEEIREQITTVSEQANQLANTI